MSEREPLPREELSVIPEERLESGDFRGGDVYVGPETYEEWLKAKADLCNSISSGGVRLGEYDHHGVVELASGTRALVGRCTSYERSSFSGVGLVPTEDGETPRIVGEGIAKMRGVDAKFLPKEDLAEQVFELLDDRDLRKLVGDIGGVGRAVTDAEKVVNKQLWEEVMGLCEEEDQRSSNLARRKLLELAIHDLAIDRQRQVSSRLADEIFRNMMRSEPSCFHSLQTKKIDLQGFIRHEETGLGADTIVYDWDSQLPLQGYDKTFTEHGIIRNAWLKRASALIIEKLKQKFSGRTLVCRGQRYFQGKGYAYSPSEVKLDKCEVEIALRFTEGGIWADVKIGYQNPKYQRCFDGWEKAGLRNW